MDRRAFEFFDSFKHRHMGMLIVPRADQHPVEGLLDLLAVRGPPVLFNGHVSDRPALGGGVLRHPPDRMVKMDVLAEVKMIGIRFQISRK